MSTPQLLLSILGCVLFGILVAQLSARAQILVPFPISEGAVAGGRMQVDKIVGYAVLAPPTSSGRIQRAPLTHW